jgi:hypothetical protein
MFIADEPNTNRNEIGKIESLLDRKLPTEYIDFLLAYNGASCFPNRPSISTINMETKNDYLFPIERFLSVGDILNYKTNNCWFDFTDHIPNEDLDNFSLNRNNLMIFAVGYRGNYLLNLDEHDYSRVYFSCYSGCDGLSKLETNSFNEFLESLSIEDGLNEDDIKKIKNYRLSTSGNKCFSPHFFYHGDDYSKIYLDRFIECYNHIHEKSLNHKPHTTTLLETWMNYPLVIKYLLSRGHKPHGLKYAKHYEIIKLLTNDNLEELYVLDIQGEHTYDAPISRFSKSTKHYEVFHEFLINNENINWNFKDLKGMTVFENLIEMTKRYYEEKEKIREQYKRNGQLNELKPYFRSKIIDNFINNDKKFWHKIFK